MYSIVIPVYNERETIPTLYERVKNMIDSLDAPAEVLIVEDGGTDGSLELLREIHRKDPRFKILSFSRNFGHQVAISAGLEHATGDAVMIIDGDLQDPPEVLPQFIAKWKEGFDVVYAIRRKRKENIFTRAAYAMFYRILNRLSYLDTPLDSGDFCLMDKTVVEAMRKLPERKRFVRGLRTWVGFRQVGLAYERDKRFAGEPKYTFTKLLGLAYDGIFSISTTPLRIAVYIGFTLAALAFLGGLLVVYDKLVHGIAIAGWSSTIVIITFLGGVILSTLGMIGEYVSRIYEEVKSRPLYIVREKLGL
jgi:glycosyltransferase involved in cell wall biosynthesis